METEIELKFFVFPEFVDTIIDKISGAKVIEHSCLNLGNIYFDTPEQHLRKHDTGLRIRRFNDERTQTLKTAGRVVAGLHQRPEYNAEHDCDVPNVYLHPQDAWPSDIALADLQSQLSPLFSTNFLRKQWLIEMPDGSEIELAFDQGDVIAGDRTTPICEVELELKSGQTDALFTLARDLCSSGGMRLGNQSKAAKGYRLAMNTPADKVKPLSLVKTESTDSVETCFVNSLEYALFHWHYHEQIYIDTQNQLALQEIRIAIAFLRQIFLVFGEMVPKRASELLRQELKWLEEELHWLDESDHLAYLIEEKGHVLRKLDARKLLVASLKESEKSLPNTEEMMMLLVSSRYCGLLLDLSRWILTRDWQPFLDDKKRQQLQESIDSHSGVLLDRTWEALDEAFSVSNQLLPIDYFKFKMRLRRNLMTGTCFALIYDDDRRKGFRLPWLDLLQGIDDLMSLEPLRTRVQLLDDAEEREQLERWLLRQERSILHAMEQTRQAGLEYPPYWQ
jgi:triphosphatase